MKRSMPMLLVVLSLMIGIPIVAAQDEEPTPIPPVDNATQAEVEAMLDEARQTLDAAQETQSQAELALSVAEVTVGSAEEVIGFVELILTAGTILFALAGFFGLRKFAEIDKLKKELEQAVATANKTQEETAKNLAELDKALIGARNTANALTLLQLGEGQYETGNFAGALKTYNQAVDLDPDNQTVNYMLGVLYLRDHKYDRALDHLERTLESDAHFPPAIAAQGYALRLKASHTDDENLKESLYAKAESRLLEALVEEPRLLDPESESYYAILGGLHRRRGNINKAIAAYRDAETITPQSSYPVVNLASLYMMIGDQEESDRYFTRSFEMASRKIDDNPADLWGLLDVAQSHLCLGRTKEALETYKAVGEQGGSVAPIRSAHGTLIAMRDAPHPPEGLEEAISLIEGYIKADED